MWNKGGRVARVISGIAHAAVIGLLTLGFVGFTANCGSPLGGDVTGYQALGGFTLPYDDAQSLALSGIPVASIPSFGPNLWIALLILAAVIGMGAAVVGGPRAAAIRIATAAVGIFAAWAAIAVVYPATFDVDGTRVTTNSDPGGQQLIFAVLVTALVADCLRLLVRWSRQQEFGPPATDGVRDDAAPSESPP